MAITRSSEDSGSADGRHPPCGGFATNRRRVVLTMQAGLASMAGCIGGKSPPTESADEPSEHTPTTTLNEVNTATSPTEATETQTIAGKHLFILTGQSNMARMDPSESFTPTVQDEFGQENVIVVKRAEGGRAIRRWYKDWENPDGDTIEGPGAIYDNLMIDVREAIDGAGLQTITVVWMQGERDAAEGFGEVYAESLGGVMNQFRSDFGRENINFVIGRISDYDMDNSNYTDWTDVRQALVNVAESEPNTVWVNTDDLNGEQDNLHYTGAGYKKLGRRFAKEAIELIKDRSE